MSIPDTDIIKELCTQGLRPMTLASVLPYTPTLVLYAMSEKGYGILSGYSTKKAAGVEWWGIREHVGE